MQESRFCPNCGSRKVEPDFRRTNVLGEIIANQNKWYCRECDYSGWMPAGEKEGEAEDIEFEKQEQPEIDTDLGRGYARYLFYITIPITLIYVLIKLLL